MTFSLIAREPETGHLGVAVASRFFAVGATIPFITPFGAIASQALVNPLWGVEGSKLLEEGQLPEAVLKTLKDRDTGHHQRQVHVMAANGQSASFTGSACIDWAGHKAAENISVAGNMLAGSSVLEDMLSCYLDTNSLPFAERLLLAMEAGEAAGGDKRGRQSASLTIHRGEAFPWIDLRCDDDAQPLAEIRRLLDVAGERYIHFTEMMGSSSNFSGHADRSKIEALIKAGEEARRAENKPSSSRQFDRQQSKGSTQS